MWKTLLVLGCAFVVMMATAGLLSASGLPVVPTHPRVMLTAAIKAELMAKKNANDPRWLKLKARADLLATYSINQYKWAARGDAPENSIYYTYQGEGWYSAAMPLALAYQMTGDTKYSDKLFALVDEMLRAQADPDNTPPTGFGPLVPDNYYSTRALCPVLAIAYDWCYDQLTPARKGAIVALMNVYYNELRDNAYQRNDHADGNYYVGHLYGTAMMGYASFGDNPRAQEMIDWARIRFDGTASTLLDTVHRPEDFFSQLFEGGTRPQPAREYLGPNITGAPHKGGIHLQGWAYGTGTYNWIIDYMVMVRTATTEDLLTKHQSWFSQMLRALKSGLLPNRFEMDNTGDYGGNYGAVIFSSLPIRLANILKGTADGPGAQSFAYSEIAKTSPYPVDFPNDIYEIVYKPTEWEDFYYTDTTRASQELILPPFYSGFAPAYPQGGATNGAMPFFYVRSDWSANATWASIHQGAAWYDDHQHADAGTFQIKHANDYLLVDASNWKGDAGSIGIVGSSQNAQYNAGAAANTLFFDDYGDYQIDPTLDSRFCGGQGLYGRDVVTAAEQNLNYTYIRADHSTAYLAIADTTDLTVPKLDYFYRSIAYLPTADLFFVFDQTKARASTNPRGEYRKHMRWHFPNRPTINGTSLTMNQGASRLSMAFLLPSQAVITAVDESNNPDPCDGITPGCQPFGFNSGTWRAEVRDGSASLTTPFLAVLHPSSTAEGSMNSTLITSSDGSMSGAKVILPVKGSFVMMFNTGEGKAPSPITSASYTVAGANEAQHTLGGMKPTTQYAVVVTGPNVSVTENQLGTYTSSAAGVLQFGTAIVSVEDADRETSPNAVLSSNYPNPFSQFTTIKFALRQSQHVTLTLNDSRGCVVRTLVDAVLPGRDHSVQLNADGLADGVYSYVLNTNGTVQTGQCVRIK